MPVMLGMRASARSALTLAALMAIAVVLAALVSLQPAEADGAPGGSEEGGSEEGAQALLSAGAVLTEGDVALNADAARERFGVDGSGVRVAVISRGIRGLSEAVEAGEAPKLAEIRTFPESSGEQWLRRINADDEGTALIEIVHDLAPGASISFGSVESDRDHVEAINYFAARVDLIVDNVSFLFRADQQSEVSRTTEAALQHEDWPLRLYVTAAGNWAQTHWSGQWRAGPDAHAHGLPLPNRGAVHQFDSRGDSQDWFGAANRFGMRPGERVRVALFWDDPVGRSTNDYDLYLLSASAEIVASSERRQGVGVSGQSSRETLEYSYDGLGDQVGQLFIVIQNHNDDAGPVRFDLFIANLGNANDVGLLHQTPEGSLLAQSDAAGALTVGAVNVGRSAPAPYSSRGPTLNGALKPDLAASDQVSVSDATTYAPAFSGTSAAAAHVAGVAALMLEAQPALLASNGGNALLERGLIREILTDTARDIPPPGPDVASGHGLVDAEAAIQRAIDDIVVVSSDADSGPGSLRAALFWQSKAILFDESQAQRTIVLRTELPPVAAGVIIDGSGWAIDASAGAAGLELGDDVEVWGIRVTNAREDGFRVSGDRVRLEGVSASGNVNGITVLGADAQIHRADASTNRSTGISVRAGASGAITQSVIADNTEAGVVIEAGAGEVLVAPSATLPGVVPAWSLIEPIGVLHSPPLVGRAGLSQRVVGLALIGGRPAPADTLVEIYLDRRLAAAPVVGTDGRFEATVTGPGAELRFAVDGVVLADRIPLQSVGEQPLVLRAEHQQARALAPDTAASVSQGNTISGQPVGVSLLGDVGAQAGRRVVWGNAFWENETNLRASSMPPSISERSFTAAGLRVSGDAPGAASVQVYAGTERERRLVGAGTVVNETFDLHGIAVEPTDTHISVTAHTLAGVVTGESETHRLPPAGVVHSVTPNSGYAGGHEQVEICGRSLATLSEPPRVWFGGQAARVTVWSDDCVTIATPPMRVGLLDITLLPPSGRPLTIGDGFDAREVLVVRLAPGWNFVSWLGGDVTAREAFGWLSGASFRAYAFDAEREDWQMYATSWSGRFNTLLSVEYGQPLWIMLESEAIDWRQPAPK